jgi:hypothetical protein
MDKKLVGTAIAAFCLCSSLKAQSILSLEYPGGLPIAHSTGSSLGMEGAGTGVQNDYFGMSDNVANIGATNRAVFSGVLSLDWVDIQDNGLSGRLFSAMPRLISFEVPITALGTFGFSFDERSSTNFNSIIDSTMPTGIADTTRIASVGGIKVWQLGWGHGVDHCGFAGISFERLFYSSYTLYRYSTSDPTGGFPLCDTNRYSSGGDAVRAGILIPIQKFTIGVNGEYIFTGSAATAKFSHTGIIDTTVPDSERITDSATSRSFAFTLPSSFSAGVSYAPNPKWLFAASSNLTFWNSHSYDLPRTGDTVVYTARNTVSISAGAQFIPAPNMLLPQYWQIMRYRAGIRYSQLPDGASSETAATVGIGLPLLNGGGLLDLNAEFGRRTDTRFGGYAEDFLQISVGLDGGRQWSQNTGVHY